MRDPLGCPAHSRNPGGHEPCCCRQVLPPPMCAPSVLQLGRCGLSFRSEESGGTLPSGGRQGRAREWEATQQPWASSSFTPHPHPWLRFLLRTGGFCLSCIRGG